MQHVNAPSDSQSAPATSTFQAPNTLLNFFSKNKTWILMILLGQIVALFNSGTAVFSKFLTEHHVSVPFFQSLLNYITLNLYIIPLISIRSLKYNQARALQSEYYAQFPDSMPIESQLSNTDNNSPSNMESLLITESNDIKTISQLSNQKCDPYYISLLPPLLSLSPWQLFDLLAFPKFTHLWAYMLISLLDVLGNFFIVKAYNYTTMLAVQVIDSANIPFVLTFSYLILSRKFSMAQIVACFFCIIGLILCIITDSYSAHGPSSQFPQQDEQDQKFRLLFGDGLVVLACTCYALANVIQERVLSESTHVISSIPNIDTIIEYYTSLRDDFAWDIERYHNFLSNSDNSLRNDKNSFKIDEDDEVLQNLSHNPIKIEFERIFEYLSMLGICGTVIGSLCSFFFEFNILRDLVLTERILQPNVMSYLLGFTLSIGLMYLFMPILIANSGAVVLNLSLLMTDVYSAIASYLVFNHNISFIYIIAFVIIATGLIMYNSCKPPEDADQSLVESNSSIENVEDKAV